MILLKTQRLYLRNVVPCDVDIMFDYRNNEICSRYQRGQTKTLEGIEDLVQRRKDDQISIENPFILAVALKETNEMIGEIVVMPNENTFSLGYIPSKESQAFGKWITQSIEEEFAQVSQ